MTMKRLTPQEFDEYLKKNMLKEIEQNPTGCVVGCLYDLYFPDNKLTECFNSEAELANFYIDLALVRGEIKKEAQP